MATIDVIQKYGRKLKHPKIRKWKYEKGEWGYYTYNGTKTNLLKATKMKDSQRVHWVVAYMGKEYDPTEFLKKFPKFRLKKI